MDRLFLEARPHPSHGDRDLSHGCNSGLQNPLWALQSAEAALRHCEAHGKNGDCSSRTEWKCELCEVSFGRRLGRIVCWCSLLDKGRTALLSL